MTKPRFTYRVDLQARKLRAALAWFAKGHPEPLRRYLLAGGKITHPSALVYAIIDSKPRRGRPPSGAKERADAILAEENRFRRANGKNLSYGRRAELIQ